MFLMDCIDNVLANACKAGLMFVIYDDGRIDTEVTKRNMQRCITWKKITKEGKGFEDSAEACGTSL